MRIQQLLCLLLVVIQGTLFAQNNNIENIRPAKRVEAHLTELSQQQTKQIFTSNNEQQRAIEKVNDYELLTMNVEQSAALLYEAPVAFNMDLPRADGQILRLQLVRVDLPNPVVLESATQAPVAVQHAIHYQGIIADDPTSLVALSVLEDEVIGIISADQLGGNWVLGKMPPEEAQARTQITDYVFYHDLEVFQDEAFSCGTPDTGEGYTREELEDYESDGRTTGDCVKIYFEVNYDIYLDKGSIQATVQYVEALFNQVATIYANEQVNLTISEIMVWNTPSPYTSTSSGQMLTAFQNNRTSFNGDLGQLLSYQASGGIAVVNGLCHPYSIARMSYAGIGSSFQQVPTYSWSVMVVAHELGHLLGSQHTHACVWNGNNTAIDSCPGYTEGNCGNPGSPSAGGTIMSYCHLTQVGINFNQGFGIQPGNLIRNKIAAATCTTACSSGNGGGNGGGGNDDDPNPPSCAQEQVILRLQLDTYSPETSWDIRNAQGTIVAEGGPYGKDVANQLLLDSLCLPEGCYTFKINDAYNDGICCDYGQGSYTLNDIDLNILAQGGEFTNTESTSFCVPFETGGDDDTDCEAIDFDDYTVESYGLNQDVGQFAIQDDGQTIYLANNAWKSIPMDYDITRETVISFDFKSTREGEIHGIGFDNNESISYGYTFKVHGTQSWGISAYDNYAGGSVWQSYTIPVGDYYIGLADRLFFCADHDGGTRDGNAWFRNVRIYEGEDCQTGDLPAEGGLPNPETTLDVQTYPNPVTSGLLQLRVENSSGGTARWEILSLTGQILEQEQLQLEQNRYQQDINLPTSLPRGTYLLRWRDEQGEKTTKFTVQ